MPTSRIRRIAISQTVRVYTTDGQLIAEYTAHASADDNGLLEKFDHCFDNTYREVQERAVTRMRDHIEVFKMHEREEGH